MSDENKLFTAAQIARAAGISRQSVRRQLGSGSVTPTGQVMAGGNSADAWALVDLPESLRSRLAENTAVNRCRDGHHLITSAPAKAWIPPSALSEISDRCVSDAVKLMGVLKPLLLTAGPLTGDALVSAIGRYRKAFGKGVTTRYIRELLSRTVRRDAGAQNWDRIALYLPERTAEKSECSDSENAPQFQELAQFITACSNPPSPVERRGVWTLALETYGKIGRSGLPPKKAARQVRDYLFGHAAFLTSSRDSLLKMFNRLLKRWNDSNGDPKSLKDKREENGRPLELPERDRDLLIHRAVFYNRGTVAAAWRDLMKCGFSDQTVARYAGAAERKSRVPSSVMDAVAAEVEILTVMHQGPRAFDQIKGHVDRSYEGIASRKCMSADDFTMPVYFYVPDGKGWYLLTRGQVLIFIDFRSLRVLGYSLEPNRNYSSLTIRSLCTHVFGEHGVPSVLQFERGIWESSKLIKGGGPHNITEVSQGLKEFGIHFIHSIRARSKTVERVGGLLQDLMEAEPGYCGRDERRDAPETLRAQMAAVEGRKAGALERFYSYDQWNSRLGEIVARYNAEPQQGKILKGLSPDAAFSKFADANDPPMEFGAQLRYLLAHDKREARVTLNGITIQIGKKDFNYRGKEISHLTGETVLAWFDPEHPEILTVTDLERRNPICVSRSGQPSALECLVNPQSESLATELSRVEGQASHFKTRFNILKTKFPMPQRQLLADAHSVQAAQLGIDMAALKSEMEEQQSKQAKTQQASRKASQELNLTLPPSVANRPDCASKLVRLKELLLESEGL